MLEFQKAETSCELRAAGARSIYLSSIIGHCFSPPFCLTGTSVSALGQRAIGGQGLSLPYPRSHCFLMAPGRHNGLGAEGKSLKLGRGGSNGV